MSKLTKKQKRINSLIAVRSFLDRPIKGGGKHAPQCSYGKEYTLKAIELIDYLIVADGVSASASN